MRNMEERRDECGREGWMGFCMVTYLMFAVSTGLAVLAGWGVWTFYTNTLAPAMHKLIVAFSG